MILADADHYGSTDEMALEVLGGGQCQQVRVDIGGLQFLQDSARVSQCGAIYGAWLVHRNDQCLSPGWE
jgi:hypothetical protein